MSYYMEHDEPQETALPPETPAWEDVDASPFGAPQGGESREGAGPAEDGAAPPATDASDGIPGNEAADSGTAAEQEQCETAEDSEAPDVEPPAPEKPKRRRTVRKKAEPMPPDEADPVLEAASEEAAEGEDTSGAAGASEPGDNEPSQDADDVSQSFGEDDQDHETAAFLLEESGEDEAPQESHEPEDGENTEDTPSENRTETPAAQARRARQPRRTAAAARAEQAPKGPFAKRPLNDKPALLSLDLNKLDQELTEEEREEWNAIYASYRSKSLLTGRIMGIDEHSFTVRSRETGKTERRRMLCAAIIQYRVKVLIPETEVWLPGQERPPYVLRNMSGAEIDYTILDVDREGGVAIGSRRMAALARRHFFDAARGGHELGEKLTCRVLSVGPKRCLVECGGRDLNLSQRDLTYTATPDLRERYHPGQTLDCILKEYDRGTGQLWVSVKETTANPFFGAVKRHPVGSRRQAVISGKYAGGVFCTLPDETVCLCLYSTRHSDSDFHVGDTVILAIKKFDYDRSLIYGRILSKW